MLSASIILLVLARATAIVCCISADLLRGYGIAAKTCFFSEQKPLFDLNLWYYGSLGWHGWQSTSFWNLGQMYMYTCCVQHFCKTNEGYIYMCCACEETSTEKLYAQGVCAWSITRFGQALDHSSIWLSEEDANEATDSGLLYLQTFMLLAKTALDERRPRYRLRPKMHSFCCEILQRLYSGSRLNPRFVGCSMEEDYVGKLISILKSKSCHPSTFGKRVLERAILGINVHLMSIRKAGGTA